VPVLIIRKEGARFPDKYKNNTELFPSNELIEETFQGPFLEPCRDIFKTKAIQHSNEYFGASTVKMIKSIKAAIDKNATTELSLNTSVLSQRRKVLKSLALLSNSEEKSKHPKSVSPAHMASHLTLAHTHFPQARNLSAQHQAVSEAQYL